MQFKTNHIRKRKKITNKKINSISRISLFSRTNAIAVFLVCNLRLVFEKVKFDVRRSLGPSIDLDGRFDPSSTALSERSQTLSNGTCVSRILSASV